MTASNTGMNIVKKVSMKTLLGNVASFIPVKEIEEQRGDKTIVKEVPAIGETVWLANVVGVARGNKSGTSNYGEWFSLLGDFMAEPLVGDKAGKRFRTGQIFLPDVIMNMIAGSVGSSATVPGGVEFNFKVGIMAVPTDGERPSATGYEYVADFVVAPTEADPFSKLLDAGRQEALPAPETEKKNEKPVDKAK